MKCFVDVNIGSQTTRAAPVSHNQQAFAGYSGSQTTRAAPQAPVQWNAVEDLPKPKLETVCETNYHSNLTFNQDKCKFFIISSLKFRVQSYVRFFAVRAAPKMVYPRVRRPLIVTSVVALPRAPAFPKKHLPSSMSPSPCRKK